VLLGDIADKRFSLLRSMLQFHDLFVSFVHCAQMAETPCLQEIVLKFGLQP